MSSLEHIETPKTAMILAAGLGQRMRPLTDDKPKALVEVAGKPLIGHLLDALQKAGVEKIVINVHYLPGILRKWIHEHPLNGRIIISDESDEILDTGGGIKSALPHLGPGSFYAANCDSFFPDAGDNPFLVLNNAWKPDVMDGLLLLKETAQAFGYDHNGDFFLGENETLSRPEKDEAAPFAYVGLQILTPKLFAEEPEGVFSLNKVYDQALASNKLCGVAYPGRWFHIGTQAALAKAEAILKGADD